MKYLRSFVLFWYHFIVGDDWRIAFAIVLGLGLTDLLVHNAMMQSWWLLPVSVVVVLTLSLWIGTRRNN